ncbi:hypothetical protein C7S20_00530 [Christiangramia fulva]|uniref:Uncharacterized protein n=2 Tax=Christiangramia fulva TaxID=2126553 RepID=A0A2R3Z0U1_9FLAO|nr:hypothetical protein C7S20_00530 [Christiangramia fulva]
MAILATIPVFIINLYAVVSGISWGINLSEILIILILFAGFRKRIDPKNVNLIAFVFLSIAAYLHGFIQNDKTIYLICMMLVMISYIFLYREALNYTQTENASKFMRIFFVVVLALNVYFLYGHLEEVQARIKGALEFGVYWIYYLNLLVLAIIGLVYYLNSYSRKSVYFISLVLAVVFSDVFRDMANFYLSDTSVLLVEYFLKYGAFILVFQFFGTGEKKLRLINLV